jgi:pyruvate kinase
MNRIAEQVERDAIYWSIIRAQSATPDETAADAIAAAAHQMVDALSLDAIMAWTNSGSTALRLSRERPNATVIALTPRRETARRLALAWGTHPIVTKDASDVDDMSFRAAKFAVREKFAAVGDRVIVVAGLPFGTPGATNLVRLTFITREHAEKA